MECIIQDSKNYLYTKGLTETDIEEMLEENNADEITLVPFALALSIIDIQENTGEDFQLSSFIPCCRAIAGNISNKTVLGCAISAVGADVLWALRSSSAKVWTVAIVKKLFKTVLPKIIGPAGATITVVSFGMCIGAAWAL